MQNSSLVPNTGRLAGGIEAKRLVGRCRSALPDGGALQSAYGDAYIYGSLFRSAFLVGQGGGSGPACPIPATCGRPRTGRRAGQRCPDSCVAGAIRRGSVCGTPRGQPGQSVPCNGGQRLRGCDNTGPGGASAGLFDGDALSCLCAATMPAVNIAGARGRYRGIYCRCVSPKAKGKQAARGSMEGVSARIKR